jgi:hypothetical protein
MIFWRLRTEFKLSRARKYLKRQRQRIEWDIFIASKANDEQKAKLEAIRDAEAILCALTFQI